MPRHSLFPNSISINYTANGHSHRQVLPIAAVTPVSTDWAVTLRDDTDINWTAAVDSWVAVMAELYSTADSFDTAELFDYEASDSPAIFLASYNIGVSGTNASPASPWTQTVFPFKATGGNSLRITLIESVTPPDQRESFGSETIADYCGLMEFILGDDDFIITRGGTYPSSSLGYTSKINDKLRKRYFLD